jgi:hypothetical protein
MERGICAALTLAWLAGAAAGASAQVVDLSQSGSGGTAFRWSGAQANARAGAALFKADMSGDVNRQDLIVGAPGAGPNGEGQAYVIFMGPTYASGNVAGAAAAILTGAAAGDAFGASISAGMIVRREVQPLPPRDLIIGAPAASGGRGTVYLFTGPFANGQTRSAAGAALRIVGAPGDRLGGAIIAADIDGDGYRDIVMSAPGTGRIYIVFGSASLGGTWDLSVRAADVTISTPALNVSFASADFDNDTFKDLAIGMPGASGGAGTVFMLMGRPRAELASAFALASGADESASGIAGSDAAGTTVQAADFDGDGVQDLVVTAPGAGGAGNARPGAGAAYVFWGGTRFSIAAGLSAANVTILGANAGDRLGTASSKGTIRRSSQDDLCFLAPGASAGGDIEVVYGAPRAKLAATTDLGDGIDRVLRADPSSAVQLVTTAQLTGKGEDIIAAAPAATSSSNASAGILYAVYSPTLIPSPMSPSVTVAQGSTATVTVTMTNIGTLNIPWAARSNTSWLAVSSASGTSAAGAQGQLTLTISPGNLAPGTYHGGYTFVSLSRDLDWPDGDGVTLTVTPGNVSTPAPTNPFGVPDPPDEGSSSGVSTPAGANVQVLAVRDVLVTFTNVITAGTTRVFVVANPRGGNGAAWSPWEFRISTTAIVSGPVTIGVAYDQTLAAPRGVIRIWDDAGRAAMQSSDSSRRLLFATVARLPINVTIENTPNTDLNDDGHPDLIWQNDSTRSATAWMMGGATGGTLNEWTWVTSARLAPWKLVATKDFNGDGHPDLVWQNDQTRSLVVWFMNGPQNTIMQNWTYIVSTPVPGWKVVAVADLDNDGHPDLVWQNDTTCQLIAWYMSGAQGTTLRTWTWMTQTGYAGWRVVANGDFNGDGHVDLVLQHDSTRQVIVWTMGGTQGDTPIGWFWISNGGIPGWKVIGAADFDGDGHLDVVWQKDSTRQVVVWYMTGSQNDTMLNWQYISTANLSGWRAVVP